jgi:hypothetical protein
MAGPSLAPTKETVMNYPKICVEAGSLFVEFAEVKERSAGQPIRMILDFGQDGEVLGIEIINLT